MLGIFFDFELNFLVFVILLSLDGGGGSSTVLPDKSTFMRVPSQHVADHAALPCEPS